MNWNPNNNIAIIKSLFHEDITQRLERGALKKLKTHVPQKQITLFKVPGTFEIPLALKWALSKEKFCAALALGVIIRGETSNADHIASYVIKSLSDIQLKNQKPIGYGILTTKNKSQALARSSLQEEEREKREEKEERQRGVEDQKYKKSYEERGNQKSKKNKGNKGEEAASALIQMIYLKNHIL